MFRTSIFLSIAISTFAQSSVLRLNEIQLIGSHNSYHSGLAPSAMAYLRKTSPSTAESLDYSHPSLTTQLNAGVRQLELDIFGDSKGGRYAKPALPLLLSRSGLEPDPPPFASPELMLKPGFKVLHVQDLDFRSNCQPFTGCLEEILAWSKAHPRHLPIFILIENKASRPREYMVEAEPYSDQMFDALDAEIRSVLPPTKLITPDVVRGRHKTLEQAVLTDGWPALEESRGKIVFLFDQERVGPFYTKGHPSLEGRVVFTNAKPGTPDAAFVKTNDPTAGTIPALLRKGYLVRTMADGGPAAVRSGNTAKRDAALASGAQMVSTDYPFDKKAAGSGYSVKFDHGNARCNPVLITPACKADLLLEP
jgi:hypothetical protein